MRAKTEFRSVSLARFNTGLLVLLFPFRNFADAPKPMRISNFWRIRADLLRFWSEWDGAE